MKSRAGAVAYVIGAAFLGSTIVTPLYALYRREFGFSEITLTLIYAVYVLGNLGALLIFGRFSDQVGRRRVALPAFGVAFVSALLFFFAAGTAWLFAARLLSGLAVGVISGTSTAWLAELFGPERRNSATLLATSANLLGAAAGPLLGGLLAEYAPRPLQLPFALYILLLAGAARFRVRTSAFRKRYVRSSRRPPRQFSSFSLSADSMPHSFRRSCLKVFTSPMLHRPAQSCANSSACHCR